ncbi:MAG: flagellar protein FliT [Massilia sp.]|nr:flagellar protein FliT [Massilia sp.]
MNSEQVITLYETVSDLTGQMLQAAQSRDWENLAALESHCASHIQCLKDGEPVVALTGDTRARKVRIIHQILAHDRQIRDLVSPWMAELASMINSTSASRKLSTAYGA